MCEDGRAMFELVNVAGRAALTRGGQWYDLATLSDDPAMADALVALGRTTELHQLSAGLEDAEPGGPLDGTTLGPPVPHPAKVFGIGVNYRSHARETQLAAPPAPLTFTKFPTCLVGPQDDVALTGDTVDWEVELVVVIGPPGHRIAPDDAWHHVAGLMLGQDISDRTVQGAGAPAQFSLGKSFPTFGPTGPAVVSTDALADPDDVELWCDVSGERMQHAHSSDMIFGVRQLVTYLSSVCPLATGDLIFTGTPEGVGMARGRFLAPGDLIRSGASGLGELVNRCVPGMGPATVAPTTP
jgi:2-keto-4-pentenoate hydratase/2-oxohepta-3-ene-1,7-dioic acid hydratase in catechol pathway